MFTKRIRTGGAPILRKAHQGAGVSAQRKEIRPKLVMQLARNLLALQILQRDGTFGEPPLVLDGLAENARKVVQFGTERRQFGRAAGLDA